MKENSYSLNIKLSGFAFIDEWGNCIIIVYGEKKRNSLIKFFQKYNGNKI